MVYLAHKKLLRKIWSYSNELFNYDGQANFSDCTLRDLMQCCGFGPGFGSRKVQMAPQKFKSWIFSQEDYRLLLKQL
jgi:hypothetical protein